MTTYTHIVAAGITGEGRPRPADAPAPTITGKGTAYLLTSEDAWRPPEWVYRRPATTVVASFRPDVIAAPGYRKPGDGPRQNAPGSVRCTVEQNAALQGFPADHPWQGSRTKQYQQVGNAVPPPLARAILAALMGIDTD